METELLFAKQTFCYESHHFWVMSYGNRELSYQKTQSKQALSIFFMGSATSSASFSVLQHWAYKWMSHQLYWCISISSSDMVEDHNYIYYYISL